MNKRFDIVTTFLVLCAAAVTGMAAHNTFASTTKHPSSELTSRTLRDADRLALPERAMGPTHAPLTIVEFSDFQCPYCRQLYSNLELIRHEHPDSIRVIFRHYPLIKVHPLAWSLAIASECARAQGRFESFYNTAFTKQDSLSAIPLATIARDASVSDTASFNACVSKQSSAPVVHADVATGDSLGIHGTPALIIRGRLYSGSPALKDLRAEVAKALSDN